MGDRINAIDNVEFGVVVTVVSKVKLVHINESHPISVAAVPLYAVIQCLSLRKPMRPLMQSHISQLDILLELNTKSDRNDVQINVQSEVVNAELDVMVHPFLDVIFLRVLPTNAKAQHKMTGWLHSLDSHDEITKDVRRLHRFSARTSAG